MTANYILLDRVELNATAASVTFSNIPQTGYTDLKVVISARDSSSAGANYNGYSFTIYPNGLSTNITQKSIFGNGSGASSYSDTQMYNVIDMSADTANTFSNVEIYVPNYTSSAYKSFSIDGVAEANATNSAMRMSAGLWSSTAAITSLQLNAYSTFVSGSTFSLYGIAAVGTTPAIAPKASGGNVIATDGTYWYHAFLSNGTFTPQANLTADVLVVAGGGGGNEAGGSTGYNAGGGGAGGLLNLTGQSLTTTSYTVTVGAGGGGGTGSSVTNGSNSQFGALTAAVGGGKGGYPTLVGSNGGSGGGGGSGNGGAGLAGGSATSGQGYAGGTSNSFAGAGGGGAGGTPATVSVGGIGSSAYSTWGAATSTGQNVGGTYYYAGGGGGGYNTNSGTPSGGNLGGNGGGGRGGWSNQTTAYNPSVQDAVAGTVNTGGGGGGAPALNNFPTGQYGAAGGSGIVIVRYLVA